jgi:hypothetical protein
MQFSLKELLELEDERVEEVARDRKAREDAALREREEADRRRRAEAETKQRAEAADNERRRLAQLDELARREAMQKALVEQARLEVEVRARAEERELERRHEIELQKLRAEGHEGQLASLVGASLLGAGVMLLVALGVHFGVTKPSTDRRAAELQLAAAASEGRAAELGNRVDEQRRAIEGLQKQLGDAQAELASLRSAAPKKTAPPPVPTHKAASAPTGAPPAPPVTCLKGDPLCPAISVGH